MKRVLIITTSYPDGHEGSAAAGSFVVDFARELVRQSIMVTVIAPAKANDESLEGDVQVRRFAVPHLPLSSLNVLDPRHWVWTLRTLQAGQSATHETCQNSSFDHLFALWALPSGEWARRASHHFAVPYSTWALGSDIWSLDRLPLVHRWLARTLRDAHARFADGYQLGRDVTAIAGKECAFLPSTRTLPTSTRSPGRPNGPRYRLGFLGRWHPNKGIDLLMASLRHLQEEDWQRVESVRIAGGGPLAAVIEEKVRELRKLGRPVELGNYLDRHEAAEFLRTLDFLLIPSRIESIPVVFSDAMQLSLPVIANPVGDLPDLLKAHRCGLLADELNAASFASALRQGVATGPAGYVEGTRSAAIQFDLPRSVQVFLEKAGLQ